MLVTLLQVGSVGAVGAVRCAACLIARSKYWYKETHFLCSAFWADWLHLVAQFQMFLLDDTGSATGGGFGN
jgi:hypothetical protein